MAIKAPNIKVLGARILVLEDKAESVSAGGIILQEKTLDKPLTGTVVAVGKGAWSFEGVRIPMDIAVGDTLVWTNIAGVPVKAADGTELSVINESHIIAITGHVDVIPYGDSGVGD